MDSKIRPGLFYRFLALLFDIAILGIIGFVSGLFLEDFYVSLGKYGTLIGTTIAILYFSIFQSKIGKGGTIGKKLMAIKVVDLQGNFLSLKKSLLRSFILVFPVLNAGLFSGGNGMLIAIISFMLISFTSVYLALVNKSRRCLHDILTSSIAVNEKISEFEINEKDDITKRKLIPVAVFSILLIGMGIYYTSTENTFSQLLIVKEKIEEKEGVISVDNLKSNKTTNYISGEAPRSVSYISITVRIDDKNEIENQDSKYFNEFYQIIQNEIPESEEMDGVVITLYYGFNIGIASRTYGITKSITNN